MKRLLIVLTMLFTTTFAIADNVKITIHVKNMTCSLCVTSINHALRKTEGVIKAKASLKTHNVEVITPEDLNTDALLSAIEKTGYSGEIIKIEAIE